MDYTHIRFRPSKLDIPRVKINSNTEFRGDVIKLKPRVSTPIPPLSREEMEEILPLFNLGSEHIERVISYLRRRQMNMARNPEKFPCENDPGTYTNLDKCEECERRDKCDVYVTMLNETENE